MALRWSGPTAPRSGGSVVDGSAARGTTAAAVREAGTPVGPWHTAGTAGRGGASREAMVAICDACRDATARLAEEASDVRGPDSWPAPHHPASVVICVLEHIGLGGAAGELRAVVAQEQEEDAGPGSG